MFNSPIIAYIGMVVALFAVVAAQLFPEWAGFAWTVAGFCGVGSIADLRTFVDSKGIKTYVIFGIVFIACVLAWAGLIDKSITLVIISLALPAIGVTFHQSLAKSPTATIPPLRVKS